MEELKLKIIVDGSGKIQVFDERPDPSSQEEWKSRSDEIDALVAEIEGDNSITEKEIEV
jgi:hypothetical protein